MNIKNIFAITVIALAVLGCIAAVSAESINVGGTDFNIPDGYTQANDIDNRTMVSAFLPITMIGDMDLNNIEAFTDGTNLAGVIVIDAGDYTLDDARMEVQNDTEKTISGKSGLIGESGIIGEDGNDLCDVVIFKYFENGKFYVIIGPDEATIEEIIS